MRASEAEANLWELLEELGRDEEGDLLAALLADTTGRDWRQGVVRVVIEGEPTWLLGYYDATHQTDLVYELFTPKHWVSGEPTYYADRSGDLTQLSGERIAVHLTRAQRHQLRQV